MPVASPPIRVSTLRVLAAAVVISFVATIGYGIYLQPDWESYRDDQVEYLALAKGLVERGEFTRAVGGEPFVPEPLRTPGYPLLRAGICLVAGCGSWPIALVSALLCAALPGLTFLVARRVLSERGSLVAAVGVAIYLPFAYFAAIPLSDLPATFLLLAATYLTLRARETASARWGAAAGVVLGSLALTRPAFVLLPAALAGTMLLTAIPARRRIGKLVLPSAVLLLTTIIVLAPFLAYSYRYFGGPFASSSGTGLWYGYVQGIGGGSATDLERFRAVALAPTDPAAADDIRRAGTAVGFDEIESVEAAAALREITAFNAVRGRLPQAYAWIDLNVSLARRAGTLIAHDPAGWLARGLTVRSVELWAGEEPYRVVEARAARPLGRIPLLTAHLLLFAAAMRGVAALLRRRPREALLVVAIPAYVWATSFPFVTEARYALPAMPFVVIAAVAGLRTLRARRLPGTPTTSAALSP